VDAVELARQIAADLHDQAVTSGVDPWRPYDFALAEAHRRGFDVEPIAPGAPMLNNGRATLLARDQLILYEKLGTAFEQAFLIAHEIGHVELGDAPEDVPAREIDPARATEPTPIGIDRVVDYGRRQRREVQMDLFAREFLLPRHIVRKLHLEEGLSASDIAERLGAPFDVVAQQLFDALLLPRITADPEAERAEGTLNPEQNEAAKHRGKAYLLEAGPGTGKTQTLSGRVESLLADGVDPRRILLLTFSNKAAGEMAGRIATKNREAAAAMWIGTFHAFGLDLIRRFQSELGLPKDPRMMDRTEAVELLEQEFPRLGLVHYRDLYDPTQKIADILSAISRAKDEVVDEKRYAELAGAMIQSAGNDAAVKAAEQALEVARVYEVYETLKRQANCVDFGDLVSMPVRLLEGNPAIRTRLQTKYDHVLVDEYQDVNRSSVRLLTALCGDGENLWVVGDAKQSIYRFRGASSFNMARFGKRDFVGGVRGRLKRNYRSIYEIVGAFSSFAQEMKTGDGNIGLEAERGVSGKEPELRTVDRAEQQTVLLADSIAEMQLLGHSYRNQAVLCTGNERLSTLAQDLERLGVPVLFLGNLFERPEVRDLLSLLTLLTDRRGMGLVRIGCLPSLQMPFADVSVVLNYLRDNQIAPGEWLQDLSPLAELSEGGRKALTHLAAVLEGFDKTARPWTVLATMLLDRTRVAATIAASNEVADRARGIAIWQLMNFIRVQPTGRGLPIARLLDRVRRLVRLGDDRDLRQLPAAAQGIDAVRLMTIHGAKGLEFSVVHVPNLNQGTLPRTEPRPPCLPPEGMIEGAEGSPLDIFYAGQSEEHECLFYVALSRAEDRLLLYAPTQKSNGHARPLSSFLDRLGPGLERRHVNPSRALPLASDAADIELSVDGGLQFSAHQIALYGSCARRFFYTYVLEVGGRRTMTPFMRMHEAVRTVFRSIVAAAVPIENDQELDRRISDALAAMGLADHGYVADYKALAMAMIKYFLSTRERFTPEAPTALRLTFDEDFIFVTPDDILLRSDGNRILRRIKTGHQRATDKEDVVAAAFLLAAQAAFPGAGVELVSLSDQTAYTLSLSPQKVKHRQEKLASFLGDIRLGRFPASPSIRTCPGCPSFFICGETPRGLLTKKFQ
jgi:superfamily I DNA/RNA helicase